MQFSAKLTVYILLLGFGSYTLSAQTLTGAVTDSLSGEPLISATVKLTSGKKGTTTNLLGQYTLTLGLGIHDITISYLGYQSQQKVINLKANQVLHIKLVPQSVENKEVQITAERNSRAVTSTEMSKVELKAEQIKALPVIFGEPDVLKAITLLPGIKSGGEGGTGFYVRGGGPDQNLILMDDAVIYNASHLLGFLSVFNTDAVRNVEIIKGGMAANYGGRLSSILNVNLREGNEQKYQVNGGVGLIASRLMLEGPIKKGKSGFMIAARRTYIDEIGRAHV